MDIYEELAEKVRSRVFAISMTKRQKVVVNLTIREMWDLLGGNDLHQATFTETSWVIAHPLPCRLQEGGLLACPLSGFDEPPGEGYGIYQLRDDKWTKVN